MVEFSSAVLTVMKHQPALFQTSAELDSYRLKWGLALMCEKAAHGDGLPEMNLWGRLSRHDWRGF
jgi:hypothetical protein